MLRVRAAQALLQGYFAQALTAYGAEIWVQSRACRVGASSASGAHVPITLRAVPSVTAAFDLKSCSIVSTAPFSSVESVASIIELASIGQHSTTICLVTSTATAT